MNAPPRIREIPFNYTSFSDREIVIRLLGPRMWAVLNELRDARRTGRSARMLLEVLGDLWIITRNPLLQDDLHRHSKRLKALLQSIKQRLDQVEARANNNTKVLDLLENTRKAVELFTTQFHSRDHLRTTALRKLARVTRKESIDFTAIARVSQSTDATDWRVELPFVVITPDSEAEMAPVVAACIDLGLTIIPRGGGTGYTGSAIPIHPETAVINSEKLDFIDPVVMRTIPGVEHPVPTIRVGAGAVTKRVEDAAQAAGFVFAVDPTSRNASTIGGNIAMNAGGKKAVLWGTTLDNLVSWRMVTPQGGWLEVTRISHNLGKIHDAPTSSFRVERFQANGHSPDGEPELLTLAASEIRKTGLGKDVSNKFLGRLPGVQKEGCDGYITSAVFLLHKMPRFTRTVCLEFYGQDLRVAVPAIVETKNYLDSHEQVKCAGLEHMDERYVRAVGYNAKGSRGERPKMVLIADVVGDDESAVAEAAQHVVELASSRNGEGFIAVSEEGRARFWADRSRTAAIASHTNAFKVNEDVVIPLEQLAAYTEGIERINIEQSIKNKIRIAAAVEAFLISAEFAESLPEGFPSSREGEQIVADKIYTGRHLLQGVSSRWQAILHHLDTPVGELPDTLLLSSLTVEQIQPGDTLLNLLLRRDLRVSYRGEAETPIKNLFSGALWTEVHHTLDRTHASIRSSRLFAAMHMHAGDGNVHTNIPVNSNDYEMLQEADRMVDRIMNLAKELGGEISGEHGIGMTKLKYLDPAKLEAFARYKKQVDPNGNFNRGKLLPGATLEIAYTPSLRLVQQEALILRESAFGNLNDAIRNCLRCGKCKYVCTTHVPRANLLYAPRNKILAAGLIIEAFLYEEQARRGISIHHFDEMNDLADHCTICRRCATPCPVDIDFGQVTVQMRQILQFRRKKRTSIGTRMALAFLTTTSPRRVRWMRQGMIRLGYHGQKIAYQLIQPTHLSHAPPQATHRYPTMQVQLVHLLNRPLPAERLPSQATRTMLGLEDPRTIPIVRDLSKLTEQSETVFYFPGCGCERLFSDIALATLAMLHHAGVQTVLPPGYVCCGFPQSAAGQRDLGRSITTANRVLFHRVANTLNYLEIKTVLVSCGTCLEQLHSYEFDKIFPGSRLLDIHEYMAQKGIHAPPHTAEGFLYHDPCHSPIKTRSPMQLVSALLGGKALLTDRCCGEAGTFAVSRPDVATQVRFSKEESLLRGQALLQEQRAPAAPPIKVLTSCPSCLQGLTRYQEKTGLVAEFLIIELARRVLGENWQKHFISAAENDGIERVLL